VADAPVDQNHPWVVVGCGVLKRAAPSLALDLYASAYARTKAAWARSVTTEDRILVLSAKHGLVPGTFCIEPYDVTFRSPDAVDADTLAEQAADLGLSGQTITLAGLIYRGRLMRGTRGTVEPVDPFVEMLRAGGVRPGIGSLMRVMKEWTGRVPPLEGVSDSRLDAPGRDLP
jgi:hypothetical protein